MITLTAYTIDNNTLTQSVSDLQRRLETKLKQDVKTGDRRFSVSKSTNEEIVLIYYNNVGNERMLFGAFLRIMSTSDKGLSDDIFNENFISPDDIPNSLSEKSNIHMLGFYYFMIHGEYFITNIPKQRIKIAQNYFNWLLGCESTPYNFTPLIETPKDIRLNDIKSIIVKEQPQFKGISQNYSQQIFSIKHNLIESITGIPNLQNIINNQILSAELRISFKKPTKMTDSDYKKILGTYIKPINDDEGVTFKLNNGRTIKGSNILKQKNVTISNDMHIKEICDEFKEFMFEVSVK